VEEVYSAISFVERKNVSTSVQPQQRAKPN
jgi:hypothetical protein